MAYFTARDSRAADYCQRMVEMADVYVGIVGLRYGSPVRDRLDVSYVELEFETATQRGLPRLIFLLDEDAELPLPANRIIDSEYGARQVAFRRRLADAGLMAAKVASAADLESRLYQALIELAATGAATVGNPEMVGASVAVPLGRQPIQVRGREDLLQTLLTERGLVVVAAMGGMGKSAVAAELTQRVPPDWPVWWVSVADSLSLAAGMVTVARRLGVGETDLRALAMQAGDAPDRFWAALERARAGWLLVFDNADQPELLAAHGALVADGTGWARASDRGLVLVTSRQTDPATWGRAARVHRLHPLSGAEAAHVLLDLAPHAGEHAEAEALGRRLGGLPLALHLSGSYLNAAIARWSSFESYQEALDQEAAGTRLLSPDPDTPKAADPRATVMRTWELSLDDLSRHGLPHARALLRLLSCFAPGVPIPIDVLDSKELDVLLTSGPAGIELEKALRALARLGLIDTVPGQRTVIVHPVIADTSRAHLRATSDPAPAVVWHTAVRLLAGAVHAVHGKRPGDWGRVQALTPHLRALLDVAGRHLDHEDHMMLVEASGRVVAIHHSSWATRPALDLTRIALARSSRLGADQPAIPALRHLPAYEAFAQGRWGAAERAFREVLEQGQHVLGDDHPDSLETRFQLAWTLTTQGRWAESEALLRELLQTRRRVLGPDHPATLEILHALARDVGRLSRWAEVEHGLCELVTRRWAALGDGREYPAVTIQARWAEAEAISRENLEARLRVLGEDHPDTLFTRCQIARHAAGQGRWSEAEVAFGDVADRFRRVLGDDHMWTLESRELLGWTMGHQGRWSEAEAVFQDVLAVRRRLHGDHHPCVLISRHRIAVMTASQGHMADAEAAFRELLDDRRRILGDHHPDTLDTHFEFANAMASQDEWTEVDVVLKAVGETRRLVLGSQSED